MFKLKAFCTAFVFLVGMFALITAAAIPAESQPKDRIIVNRPGDPLDRDPTRPDRNLYELSTTITGTPSQVEAALKDGNEAFAAKPQRLADAAKFYLEAAKLGPKEARAYMGLGLVYAAQDRANDALLAFQKAVELKPKLAAAHFDMGVILVALGEKTRAMEQRTVLEDLDKKLAKTLNEMIKTKFE